MPYGMQRTYILGLSLGKISSALCTSLPTIVPNEIDDEEDVERLWAEEIGQQLRHSCGHSNKRSTDQSPNTR